MTCAENLAAFVCRSGYEDLSDTAREQLKVRILDSLGCALGALDGEPVQILRWNIDEFGSPRQVHTDWRRHNGAGFSSLLQWRAGTVPRFQ